MIIVVSDDKDHLPNANKLAQVISSSSPTSTSSSSTITSASHVALEDNVAVFSKADLSTITDARVTFTGHGSKTHFGSGSEKDEDQSGYTPTEFVAKLKAKGLLSTVQVIDLFACNVGLTNQEGKSYASELAALLKQDSQFRHIKLNAFTANAETYSRKIVSVEKATGKVYVSGIKNENESAYQQTREEIAALKERLKSVGEIIIRCKKTIANQSNPNTKANIVTQIEKHKTNKAKINKDLDIALNKRKSFREELDSSDNFRNLLDSDEKYHIKPYNPKIDANNKKRPHSTPSKSSDNTNEENNSITSTSNDAPQSPTHKQAKLEEPPSITPAEQSASAARSTTSSSTLNPEETTDYSLEKIPTQSRRDKDRHYTQAILNLSQKIKSAYLPKTSATKNSRFTASLDPIDSNNIETNTPEAPVSRPPKFR